MGPRRHMREDKASGAGEVGRNITAEGEKANGVLVRVALRVLHGCRPCMHVQKMHAHDVSAHMHMLVICREFTSGHG